MKKNLFHILPLLVLLAASFGLGSWNARHSSGPSGPSDGRRVLYYVDPMNPTHTSTKPGPAPCGMPMEPVYAEDVAPGSANTNGPRHPGTVSLNPQRQQIVGVQVAAVERRPISRVIRTSGLVTLDEARTYRVNTSSGGWVREIYTNTTGSMVMKDEPLFAFYTPAFLTSQQAFYYTLNTLDSMRKHQFEEVEQDNFTNVQLRTATDNLRNMGVGEKQLRELSRNRQYVRNIVVSSPATGIVISRNLTLEQRFEAGSELYRIADLSSMWVLADVYKDDRQAVQPGQAVRVYSPDLGREFEAKVSHILPQFDALSRTAKVRLDVANPEFLLRPDMYVDVEFQVEMPATIHVPLDAILDAGLKKTVFVDHGDGSFEPRDVKTGWRFGDRVEVKEGLMEGENIVVSGNFLIDSESRMKLAAAGYYGDVAKDPVCRMFVDQERSATAGLKREYHGKTYFFCSALCRGEFDKRPDRFMKQEPQTRAPAEGKSGMATPAAMHMDMDGSHDHHHPGAPAAPETADWDGTKEYVKDAVCSMPVREAKARQEGLFSESGGKTYYFCTRQCKENFDKDPSRYIAQKAPSAAPQQKAHPEGMNEPPPPSPAPHEEPAPPPAGMAAHMEHRP